MRTVLFIILIIGLVFIGVYVGATGSGKSKNIKSKSTHLAKAEYPGGKADISKWSAILISGEWKYLDKEENNIWIRNISGDVQFFADGTFNLGFSINYYDKERIIVPSQKRKNIFKGGGNVKGRWKVEENYFVLSDIENCNYKNEFNTDNREDIFVACKYFEGRKYGIVKEMEKTDIKLFNKKEILIDGFRYNSGANIIYNLTRPSLDPVDSENIGSVSYWKIADKS